MRRMPFEINSKLKIKKSKFQCKIKNLKVLTAVFIFTPLVLNHNCLASPCLGIKMPGKAKFSAGLQSYYIFNRYLEKEAGEVRSSQHFLLLSYGVFDWLSIDLKGGAGNIKQHPFGSVEVDYTSNFAGGYGFRLRLCDKKKLSCIFGFQHISVHPKSLHLGDVKHQAVLDDWQVSLLVGRKFGESDLYAGSQLSRVDYIHWDAGNRKRTMSDLTKNVGLVCGTDICLTEKIFFNIEGQFINTESLSFSLNYRW
jgi:hypothetical protein